MGNRITRMIDRGMVMMIIMIDGDYNSDSEYDDGDDCVAVSILFLVID